MRSGGAVLFAVGKWGVLVDSGGVIFAGMLRYLSLALLLSCSQPPTETRRPSVEVAAPAVPVLESFEIGSKGSYAEGDEALTTGTWHFTDALIGSSAQDHKVGERAARLRGQGRLSMRFDAPAGVQGIRVAAAAYGTDGPSTWELWLSRDQGRSYVRAGAPVQTAGPLVQVRTFAGTTSEPVRLEIRKTGGGDNRMNIDDVALLYDAAAATAPAGAPTPAPVADTPAPAGAAAGVAASTPTDNLRLGNPSGATANPAAPTNYLLVHAQYATGYNAQRGTPTWTSWHLSRADMTGAAPRQDDFRADPGLPRQFYQVTPASYTGSGFDRGHNCPSADRSATLEDNSATFLMSNMVPQAPQNNQQTWNRLEAYTRDEVAKGQEAYILMGCYGRGGTGSRGPATTLDGGRVTVPARIWKVVVLLPEGDDDLARLAAGQGRVVAVDTPNDNALNPDWQAYRTSIDKIEAATGLDLLSALPLTAQARLQR